MSGHSQQHTAKHSSKPLYPITKMAVFSVAKEDVAHCLARTPTHAEHEGTEMQVYYHAPSPRSTRASMAVLHAMAQMIDAHGFAQYNEKDGDVEIWLPATANVPSVEEMHKMIGTIRRSFERSLMQNKDGNYTLYASQTMQPCDIHLFLQALAVDYAEAQGVLEQHEDGTFDIGMTKLPADKQVRFETYYCPVDPASWDEHEASALHEGQLLSRAQLEHLNTCARDAKQVPFSPTQSFDHAEMNPLMASLVCSSIGLHRSKNGIVH